jgi:hypothetical protein
MKINRKKWAIILITAIIAVGIAMILTNFKGEYGFLLFLFTPLFIGILPIILYDENSELRKKDVILIGLITLSLFSLILFISGIEGMICIAMAAPIGIVLTTIGSLIAYFIKRRKDKNNKLSTFLVILMSFSMFTIMDNMAPLNIHAVKSEITIDANIDTVWKNVIAFPKLNTPQEFIFKAGISYPIEATIKGQGKGAIRLCKFNTGDFVEPITTWSEPNLLAFDVLEQPVPMHEYSFYDIDAPHLHDYFLSKRGQFKLTKVSENKTILEGTTWYTHNIRPEFYWMIWSNHIIHKIHNRVLEHIKVSSEKS